MPIKILLLQARDQSDLVREEERRSFARKSGLEVEQIETYDLLAGPPKKARLKCFDAIMVGGSGDFSLSDRSLPHIGANLEFVADVAETGFPLYASCFGFQMLVEALGGSIVYDLDRMEVGTYEMTLTETGEADELMGVLPKVFPAQLGHKDCAERLPPGVIHLASSRLNRFQAFRIPGQPIWATQFHPELDALTNRQRFEHYLDGYSEVLSAEERNEALRRFRDSPETEALLPQFLHVVFGL